jgi:glycosyltransferase involved in cell wall biosynthesis
MMIAPATPEPFGLSVVEAMMAGVPVIAAASGGHLETVGRVQPDAMFTPGGVAEASRALQVMAHDQTRQMASRAVGEYARTHLSLERSVDRLLEAYCDVIGAYPSESGANGGRA